jgi:TolB-like protein
MYVKSISMKGVSMNNKICFVLLASLLFPCISFAYEKELKELSATLAENIANSGKKSIAVVDFVNLNGQVTDGGRFFAEEFTVNLAAAGKGFEVIERSRLNTILAEYKLASTGIIDPNTAKKLGQIAGVDAVITGTTTLLGDKIRLSVKVLAVDTAQVITAASTTITKTKENEDIWKLFTTTTETTTTGNPQPAGSSVAPATTYAKVQTRNYIFELRRCQREGSNVVCDVNVTYAGREEEQLSILCGLNPRRGERRSVGQNSKLPTKAIDDSRQEYPAEMVQLGDQRVESEPPAGTFNTNSGDFRTESQSISPGKPVVASFVFQKVAPDANFLSLLEFKCSKYSAYKDTTYNDYCVRIQDDKIEWARTEGGGYKYRDKVDFVVQFRNIPIAKDELQRK